MSKRPVTSFPIDAIGIQPLPKVYFDTTAMEKFIADHGTDWCLYTATPSVVGQIDKGDYRRPTQIDTISSNGFIYKCAGIFTGVMVSNSKNESFGDMGGLLSQSGSNMIMPRFFNSPDNTIQSVGERIYPCVGDRVYKNGAECDPNMWVVNFQKVDYDFGQNSKTAYPIKKVISLDISTGESLTEGVDFSITPEGDIYWIPSGRNPGLNPNNQKGYPFAIRYLYTPYYYVVSLPHEQRQTSVIGKDGQNETARLPYNVSLLREYLYQDQINNSKAQNTPPSTTPSRDVLRPSEPISGLAPVKVSMSDISEE